MSKVDPAAATGLTRTTRGPRPDFERYPATRAPYRQETYVRAQVDGREVDAKAIGWTREHVHLKWVEDDGETRVRWVMATDVRRIARDESRWRDAYDILE